MKYAMAAWTVAMLQQVIDTALMLFVTGFPAGVFVCLMTRPVRATTLAALAEDVGMSVQREFAKMA